MPNLGDQTLETFLKKPDEPLTPQESYATALLLALAIKDMHDTGVIHKDLKPQNILIKKSEFNLIDFGLSVTEEENNTIACGTLEYAAPEVLRELKTTKTADIFSLAGIYYSVFNIDVKRNFKFTLPLPNCFQEEQYLFEPQAKEKFKKTFNNDPIVEDILSLIRKMSDRLPEKRPTINQVCEALLKHFSFLEKSQQRIVLQTICKYSAQKLEDVKKMIEAEKNKSSTTRHFYSVFFKEEEPILKKINAIKRKIEKMTEENNKETMLSFDDIKKEYSTIQTEIETLIQTINNSKELFPPVLHDKIIHYLKCALDYLIYPLGFIQNGCTGKDTLRSEGFFGTFNTALKPAVAKVREEIVKLDIAIPSPQTFEL